MNSEEELLEHLVKMAKQPGWKAYAWHAAKHYEEINPARKGLQEKLKQRMQSMQKEQQK